jgi:hypothetical protein
MPKGKIFLVAAYSWEYNDEYYYTPDGNPTCPQIAFEDEGKADKICRKKNIEALKGLTIDHSSEGLSGCIVDDMTEEQFENFMKSLGAKNFSKDDPTIPNGLPASAYEEILEKLTLRFFTVISVERRF